MPAEHKHISRYFVLWWALATAAGTAIGVYIYFFILHVNPTIRSVAYSGEGELGLFILGLLFGSFIGILQWLILRKYIIRPYIWIIVTIFGFSLGALASMLIAASQRVESLWLFPVPAGLALGLLQFSALKQHSSRAWVWLIPSSLSWMMFFGLFLTDAYYSRTTANIVMIAIGFGTGIISGIVLRFILSKPKTITNEAKPSEYKKTSRVFGLWRALATAAGTAIGLFLYNLILDINPLIRSFANSGEEEIQILILGLCFGSCIGLFQWLILSKHIPRAYLWIIATTTGFSLGAWATMWGFPLLFPIGAGVLLGLIQVFVLQQHSSRAWIWLIPSSLSWLLIVGFMFYEEGTHDLAKYVIIAISFVTGLVSGIVFRYILSKPKIMSPVPKNVVTP